MKSRILAMYHILLNYHSLLSCHVSECCFLSSLQDYKAGGNSAFSLSQASIVNGLEMPWLVAHSVKDCIQAKLVHYVQIGRTLRLAVVEGEPAAGHRP